MVKTDRARMGEGRPAQPRLMIKGTRAVCQSCAWTASGWKFCCRAASSAPMHNKAKRLWLSR